MANLSNINNKFLVTTGGNVLIGKTAANNATVGTQIMSTGDINPTVSGDTVARFNRLSSDGEIIRIQKDTSTVGYIGSNAAGGDPVLDIGSDSSGDSLMRFLTSGSERIRIDKDGDVGIGIDSPGSKLDVDGTIRISTSGRVEGRSYPYTTNLGSGANATTTYLQAGSTVLTEIKLLGGDVGRTITFTTASTERLRIDSDGNVGIGTESPGTKLVIEGANDAAGTGVVEIKTTGTNLKIGGNTTYSWIQSHASKPLYINQLGNNVILNLGGGRVGIGTTSPEQKLHVEGRGIFDGGVSSDILQIRNDNGGGVFGMTPNLFALDLASTSAFRIRQGSSVPFYLKSDGKLGIGTTSPAYSLDIDGYIGIRNITSPQLLFFETGSAYTEAMRLLRSQDKLHLTYGWNANEEAVTIVGGTGSDLGNVGIGTTSPNRKLQVAGKAIIGSTANYSSNAGTLHVYGNNSENSGMLDIMTNGNGRYYTRVCYNATTVGQAGYWHIKTNIPVNGGIMFLAKFYGYIYGSAQVLDLQHSGYAYAAGNSVINQGTTNNGSNTNASSAIYASANGNKVTFRIAFGAGATFSTYFAGVYMDICFPNPAGRTHDFEIEAQTFNQSGTVY